MEKLLDYERGQIEDSYCAAVDKVREKMDTEMFAQVRVLEQRRDGKESDESRMSTRSLRSKKGGRADDDDDDDDDGLDRPGSIGGAGHSGGLAGVATAASSGSKEVAETAGKRRTKRALSPASMHLDKCLDEDEIKDDKYAIERDAEMQRRAEMMGQNGGKGISSGSSTHRRGAQCPPLCPLRQEWDKEVGWLKHREQPRQHDSCRRVWPFAISIIWYVFHSGFLGCICCCIGGAICTGEHQARAIAV